MNYSTTFLLLLYILFHHLILTHSHSDQTILRHYIYSTITAPSFTLSP